MFELLPLEHNVLAERGSFSDVGRSGLLGTHANKVISLAEGERGACHHHYKPSPMNDDTRFTQSLGALLSMPYRHLGSFQNTAEMRGES